MGDETTTPWAGDWRDRAWSRLEGPWDVLIIGGGITGAGILREATRLGLRALLVEQRDFAWGASSRSSKMVHGGLRYLKNLQLRLTRDAARERERLAREGAGLIDPAGFLLVSYAGDRPGQAAYGAALALYDLFAGRWRHRRYGVEETLLLAPRLHTETLLGSYHLEEATTDDARLVLRLVREAVAAGAAALNYVTADDLLLEHGCVVGARLRDGVAVREAEVRAAVVVNATGAWADRLRGQAGAPARLRPLRGSHLVFPAWRLPVAQTVCFAHPIDGRPVFVYPWEGSAIVGTTDLDYEGPLDEEPCITPREVSYLMAAVEGVFPSLGLTLADVSASYAGVRPVVGGGAADPSRESRDHVVWNEHGLLTVTGGKLTTFRLIALDALAAARPRLPQMAPIDHALPAFDHVGDTLPPTLTLDVATRRRLLGRYGADTPGLLAVAQLGELEQIPGTHTLWAELRWAARAEGVIHLDDLLLRRVRLGLLVPRGGEALLPSIRAICQPELGWHDARWEAEQAAYLHLWQQYYSLPESGTISDWRAMLQEVRFKRQAERQARRRRRLGRLVLVGAVFGLAMRQSQRSRTARRKAVRATSWSAQQDD